jgi:hypothetical protein
MGNKADGKLFVNQSFRIEYLKDEFVLVVGLVMGM